MRYVAAVMAAQEKKSKKTQEKGDKLKKIRKQIEAYKKYWSSLRAPKQKEKKKSMVRNPFLLWANTQRAELRKQIGTGKASI